MDVLYLLIPLSVLLVLVLVGVFGWAINNSQLDDLEREGGRILEEVPQVDANQAPAADDGKKSHSSN